MAMMIKTNRLQIQPLEDLDVRPLSLLFAEASVTDHLALARMNQTAARLFASEFVYCSLSEFHHQQSGVMSVKLQTEQQFLGYAGLRPLPDRTTALELTYAIAPSHWSRGLATEAADAVINWGFETVADLKEVVALSRHENPASIRVLEKLGLEGHGKTARYYGEELMLFSCGRDRCTDAKAGLA
jgi:ribosomal-protein-alanine N-acetyltransferase